ncbi:MAG: hypothetical protein ABI165_15665 [Bryobacteraceae bacterium]
MAYCVTCGGVLTEPAGPCAACGAGSAADTNAAAVTPAPVGLTSNAAAALSYSLGALTGVLFLVMDPYKRDPFVRFHAFQSLFFNLAWAILWMVWMPITMILTAVSVGVLGLVFLPLDLALLAAGVGLWLFLIYKAYSNRFYVAPVIGKFAARQAGYTV